mgnify:FL=1|jgi:hypothetical protein|tara:strand:+ start:607 stop:783 length:177 start_codon:yes stop_codon:yes gene_type:complete
MKKKVPYKVTRYFDGVEVHWLVVENNKQAKAIERYEERQEAVSLRNRLNSKALLDAIL